METDSDETTLNHGKFIARIFGSICVIS